MQAKELIKGRISSSIMAASSLERASQLACFAGRADIKIVPTGEVADLLGLGEGRTNQNFIATDGATGERLFIRIGTDLPAYGVTRAKEQAAAKAAAAVGVGAAIIHAELPDALVTAFVPGRALTEAQVKAATGGTDNALLSALTGAIRRLHETPLPAELAPPAAPSWAPPDVAKWIDVARGGGYARLPILDDVDALLDQVTASMAPWQLGTPHFCHFDLLPDNFVVDDGRAASTVDSDDTVIAVTIVDFEYANAGAPLMDLAVLSMGCGLSADEENRLVASYLKKDVPLDAGEAARFQALKLLATLRETFWGIVAEVTKCSALTDAQAAAYTDENYAKHLAARKVFEANVAAGVFA